MRIAIVILLILFIHIDSMAYERVITAEDLQNLGSKLFDDSNNLMNGKLKVIHKDGSYRLITVKDGVFHGKAESYTSDNIKNHEAVLANGNNVTKHAGFSINGMKEFEVEFDSDGNVALKRLYYESGNIKSERLYQNNKLHGTSKFFYKSGKLRFEIPYVSDTISGIGYEYKEDGFISKKIIFAKNEPISGFIYRKIENIKMTNAHLYEIKIFLRSIDD